MAGWNSENPCFGCAVRTTSDKIKKAPCCWDVALELSAEEYENHFAGAPNVSFYTIYERRIDDDPTAKQVAISGPCPNLDQATGKCFIEYDKPTECVGARPKNFDICAKAAGGRWSDLLILA